MSNRKKTPNLLDELLVAPGKGFDVDARQAKSHSVTTVAEASDRLGVSETMIRKWASEFAGDLSQEANPGKGQPRQFSDEDMNVLTTIAHQRRVNVSYDDIHKTLGNDRTEDLKQPAQPVDKLPDDPNQLTTAGFSQEHDDRLRRLEKERDQLRKQLQATKEELYAAQIALAGEQESETAIDDGPAEDLLLLDSKKSKRPGKPKADPGRFMTLEDQLKAVDKRRWWQVWKQ
jgi:DNA-binding transcriptional MerR regulator